jgi:hypothetical protein
MWYVIIHAYEKRGWECCLCDWYSLGDSQSVKEEKTDSQSVKEEKTDSQSVKEEKEWMNHACLANEYLLCLCGLDIIWDGQSIGSIGKQCF